MRIEGSYSISYRCFVTNWTFFLNDNPNRAKISGNPSRQIWQIIDVNCLIYYSQASGV